MSDAQEDLEVQKTKRKSGIPAGNAGEYFVMGELLRRGFDAQLADRNTKGYDLLVGKVNDKELRKVQIKTVRSGGWYVNKMDFQATAVARATIYVLLGSEVSEEPVRYFIARNDRALRKQIYHPPGPQWKDRGFMHLKAVLEFEGKWKILLA